MTEAEQQDIITKTKEGGTRGLAEQVAKYGVWQSISSANPSEGTNFLDSTATPFSAKFGASNFGREVPITLPPQFDSSCGSAFIDMLEAVHNTRPLGKIQCFKCRGWGRHDKANCPVVTSKQDLRMSAMDMWQSSNIMEDSKFDQFLQKQTESTPTSCGFAHIRADELIRTNWAYPHQLGHTPYSADTRT